MRPLALEAIEEGDPAVASVLRQHGLAHLKRIFDENEFDIDPLAVVGGNDLAEFGIVPAGEAIAVSARQHRAGEGGANRGGPAFAPAAASAAPPPPPPPRAPPAQPPAQPPARATAALPPASVSPAGASTSLPPPPSPPPPPPAPAARAPPSGPRPRPALGRGRASAAASRSSASAAPPTLGELLHAIKLVDVGAVRALVRAARTCLRPTARAVAPAYCSHQPFLGAAADGAGASAAGSRPRSSTRAPTRSSRPSDRGACGRRPPLAAVRRGAPLPEGAAALRECSESGAAPRALREAAAAGGDGVAAAAAAGAAGAGDGELGAAAGFRGQRIPG